MLPDDSHLLVDRVQALADWCAGVVLGFGLASGHIRADEQELIEHLQDVAAVEFEDSDNDEEGEESYQELYEFVRLIPVSLSIGRKKISVAESSLLKTFMPKAEIKIIRQLIRKRLSKCLPHIVRVNAVLNLPNKSLLLLEGLSAVG
jgi:hypothetical protein